MMNHTIEPTNSLNRTASWVIREIASKRVLFETHEPAIVAHLNTSRYEAVPILQYLQEFNKAVRINTQAAPSAVNEPFLSRK